MKGSGYARLFVASDFQLHLNGGCLGWELGGYGLLQPKNAVNSLEIFYIWTLPRFSRLLVAPCSDNILCDYCLN